MKHGENDMIKVGKDGKGENAMAEEIVFCKGGGCTAKLGAGILSRVLSALPKGEPDPNLLVGYDSRDDAAVYQVSDDLAIVQTLDFFPPMVDDPHTFGQIAAANALSDIYAMGGEVKTALNIVCFPEKMDLNVLGEIMRGGSEKVLEAGGSLVGGHSIADDSVKYGLSVMGTIDPKTVYANNHGQVGDALLLTKKLGIGILCTANRVGEASERLINMRRKFAKNTPYMRVQMSRDLVSSVICMKCWTANCLRALIPAMCRL